MDQAAKASGQFSVISNQFRFDVIPGESCFSPAPCLIETRLPRRCSSAGFQPAGRQDVCATFSSLRVYKRA
jgi:hypothetical protein